MAKRQKARTNIKLKLATAVLSGMFAVANPAWAQNMEKIAGTISEFGPDTIALRSAASREPVRYISSQTTIYVDDAGAPVLSIDSLKAGVPVTMYYSKIADQMVASRVVVHKSITTAVPAIEEKTTTTTRTKE